MDDDYSISCDYGGLGNYLEGDTTCMLCPHETECAHERELEQLRKARAHRVENWRYPQQPSPKMLGKTDREAVLQSSAAGLQPSGRRRSRRPMPVRGENPLSRAGKNILMTMLMSGFHEAGDFCEDHDFTPVVSGVAVPPPPSNEKKE